MKSARFFALTSLRVLAVTFVVISFQNCGVLADKPQDGSASLSSASAQLQSKAMEILTRKCSSCHNAQSSSGDIGSITDVNSLLYYRLVVPNEPQISDLYTVIQNGEMPIGGSMTTAEIKTIYDWINEGFSTSSPPVVAPPTACTTLMPTYSCIRSKIFALRCATCHMNGRTDGGVSVQTYTSTLSLVVAGRADMSVLYTDVNNNIMPRGGAPLSAAEKSAIQTWINNGALNN